MQSVIELHNSQSEIIRIGAELKQTITVKILMKENINTIKQDQQDPKLIIKSFSGTVKEFISSEALLCQLCEIFICVLNYTFT